MRHGIQKKIIFLLSIILLFCFIPIQTYAKETKIRVGYPIQAGLTEKDKDGRYHGYTYDYLKEIAQYTGWTYEFVEVEGTLNEQLVTLLDLLEKGEIDLLGAMSSNEHTQELYDLPSENYGNAYNVIVVSDDNSKIDEYDITDYKHFTIALLENAKNRNEEFFQYAELNGLAYEVIWCENEKEQQEAVYSGKTDALLTVNLAIPKGMHSVIKFSPKPFYFATTKGNRDIVMELNKAISYLSEVYPTLQSDLYNQYFFQQTGVLSLNNKEEAYVKEHPTLDVLVQDGFGPLQYYDKSGKIKGVAYDVLSKIGKEIGWELNYVYAKSYDDYEQKIKNKEVDLVLSINYDYDTALRKQILLSNPYLDAEKVIVAHKDIDIGDLEKKVQAVYKGERIHDEESEYIRYYDSIEKSLQAVEDGECDFTYSNSYAASYYRYKNNHENAMIYPRMLNDTIRYSVGIVDRDDRQLSTIINKGIKSITSREMEGFIYQNAQQNQNVTLSTLIKENPFLPVAFVTILSAFVILIVSMNYKNKLRMNQKLKLEDTRYRYLSDLLHEVTFTYDYQKDQVTLSKEGMKLFEADEVIENYSKYPSKIVVDERFVSMYELFSEKKDIDIDVQLKIPRCEPEWYHIVVKMISDGKKVISAVGRIENIHNDKLEKEKLIEQSRFDGLTNIYNASTTKKDINERIKKGTQQHAFMILDLDNFKGINDNNGHYIGDLVLVEIAKAMKIVFKEESIIGRLGGDEFVVFIPLDSIGRLKEQIEMFYQELKYQKKQTSYPIPSVSIGIAIQKEDDSFTDLYQRADKVLYGIKNQGKNNYKIEE